LTKTFALGWEKGDMTTSNNAIRAAKAILPITTQLYYGTFVHSVALDDLEIRPNGLIVVDTEGRITKVFDDVGDGMSDDEVYEFYVNNGGSLSRNSIGIVNVSGDKTKFLIPGFIDTHIHASQFPNVGVGLGVPLLKWLDKYTFKLESQFTIDPTDSTRAIELANLVYSQVILKTLSNGTTCASYFTTIDPTTTNIFADLLLEYGQRGFIGKVCMNDNSTYQSYQEDYDTCIKSTTECCHHISKNNPIGEVLIKPIITPRFAPICSKELLGYLGDFAKANDMPIQTHISENVREIDWVKSLFPEYENYASVYDAHNLLTESTILAHAVYLNDDECKLVKSRNCSISHCPASNSFLSSGEAPIKKYLRDYDINVSLGTDLSGGFEQGILAIIKQSILVSHHLAMKTGNESDRISIAEAIYMATRGGAKAVGLGDTVGCFDVGKKFDAQLIDLSATNSNVTSFDWQLPQETDDSDIKYHKLLDLLGKWIFTGDDRNCVKVWCNGRKVIDKTN
jgi:guanine deaminase